MTSSLPRIEEKSDMGMKIKPCLSRLLPYTAMVTVSCLDVVLATLSKAVMSNGMNHFVFVAYSNSLATLLLFPFAFLFNRLEKLDLTSLGSLVKIMGTAISISGALIVTLYRGFPIGPSEAHPPNHDGVEGDAGSRDWVIGGLVLGVSCLAVSVWIISQAVILKGYPSEITIVFFYCLFGAFQSTIVALAFVRDWSAWKLKPDIELITIIYSAVLGNMVAFYVQTWCIHKKGPVFVSMFTPLGIAIAVALGVVFLGDRLYLSWKVRIDDRSSFSLIKPQSDFVLFFVFSILRAAVIVLGFYAVMWAQSKEKKSDSSALHSEKAPLIEEEAENQVC